MHKLIIGIAFLAFLWLSIEMTVLISQYGQDEAEGYTQEVARSRGIAKKTRFEVFIVVPLAKLCLWWIEKRGRSP